MIFIVIAISYLVIIPFISRSVYRNTTWSDNNSEQENRFFSFLWGLLWPLSGFFLISQFMMQVPGRKERQAARQEAVKQGVKEKARSLEKSEAELQKITDELKRLGIEV